MEHKSFTDKRQNQKLDPHRAPLSLSHKCLGPSPFASTYARSQNRVNTVCARMLSPGYGVVLFQALGPALGHQIRQFFVGESCFFKLSGELLGPKFDNFSLEGRAFSSSRTSPWALNSTIFRWRVVFFQALGPALGP